MYKVLFSHFHILCQSRMLTTVLIAAFAALASAAPSLETMKIDAEGCGQRPLARELSISPFIVGGQPVDPPYSWPFICSLQNTKDHWHFCGGSLIKNAAGRYFFITAAHCVQGGNFRQWQALCAAHDNTLTNKPYAQTLTFSAKIVHEQYNSNTLANDIAILFLEQQPVENNYLQPICISTRAHHANELATIIGWGTTSAGGSVSKILLEASKPILSDTQCNAALGTEYMPNVMLCAGHYNIGGVDSCQGDSGGPLVVKRGDHWELAGIVSWGYGCAQPQYPGVYVDVNDLKPWISSKINV